MNNLLPEKTVKWKKKIVSFVGVMVMALILLVEMLLSSDHGPAEPFTEAKALQVLHAMDSTTRLARTTPVVFKDTVGPIVFDSLYNNMGDLDPATAPMSLVKHFRYIGKEPATITRAWTGDPHYICEYPQGPLFPGQVYSITICFWHQGRQGGFHKIMGLDLSDSTTVRLHFRGRHVPG